MRKVILGVLIIVFLSLSLISVAAKEKIEIKIFYGEGCPHCAKALRFLDNLIQTYPQIEIKKYEVYLHPENIKTFKEISAKYGIEPEGVPTIFIGERYFVGFDKKVKDEIENYIKEIIEKKGEISKKKEDSSIENQQFHKFTFPKIISLAIVDSVNPCALAVLTLVLISILTYDPKNKKQVLLAGLSFSLSVFIMYLIYGLIIIKSFQILRIITPIRLWFYKILGLLAIFLGVLNMKDFIRYKPGGFLTEMPLFLRPKVKKIISGIVSSKGAFLIGLFVTLFLLPCTIGPYIIASGILSFLETIKIFPYLFIYNLIFILPMITITLIVYLGVSRIKDISAWKDKNIKYLHFVAGFIMFVLGILIIFGLI